MDSFYEFWTSTGSAQETLLSLIAQKAQTTVSKPIVNVKKETEVLEESSKDDTEEPASKRPRRFAAIKAQSSIMPESDDEDGDLDTTEIVTKVSLVSLFQFFLIEFFVCRRKLKSWNRVTLKWLGLVWMRPSLALLEWARMK